MGRLDKTIKAMYNMFQKDRTHYDSPTGNPGDKRNRLPFGLCKKFGIDTPEEWTPHDAWEALIRGGYISSVSEAYKQYYKELNDKSTEQLDEEQRVNLPNKDKVTVIDAATGKEKFGGAKTPEFVNALADAKTEFAKQRPGDAWRVSSPSADDFDKEHLDAVKHVTQGGSTVAVTPDGDIVSVCKNPRDSVSGTDLLKMAIENGGKKLDSYEGNHGFYIKKGFEPVSWCKWSDEFTPPDWKAGRDKKEDIVFYRYTGKVGTEKLSDFKKRVPASVDYVAAAKVRDDSLEK